MPNKFIRSTAFADCYLSMDAEGFTRFDQGGGGAATCQYYGSTWEYIEIVYLEGDIKGKVALKSTFFKNVYLRMYAPSNQVNCQIGCGNLEQFYLIDQGRNRFAIESAASRGRYLTMDGKANRNHNGFGFISVAGSIREWEIFELADAPPALTAAELRQVIGSYGPQLRFYSKENYYMCTVEYILAHSTLRSKSHGAIKHPNVDQLPTAKSGDGEYWLDIEKTATYGSLEDAKAYVHALYTKNTTYTDLQFWFCYGFNGPATLAGSLKVGISPIDHTFTIDQSISPVGEHFGDWECCMIRIDNVKKTWIGAWLSQHSGGQTFDKFQIGSFQKNGQGPVVYASNNGHAVFSQTGNNITNGFSESLKVAEIKGGLYNVTGNGGKSIDCRQRYQIVAADWLSAEFPRARWLDYPYRWGPTGGTPYDLNNVIKIVYDAFPSVARNPVTKDLVTNLVKAIARALPDNIDGPEGPALKDQWRGNYG